MGRRSRRRAQQGGHEPAATSDYRDEEGHVLTLRDELSAGTLRKLADLDARPAADAEDRWQRRVEFLFERLAVRWEIAGLPLEGQKELLGNLGYDPTYGARPLKRVIQKRLVDKLALKLLENEFVPGDTVRVDTEEGELTFAGVDIAHGTPVA